MADNQEAFDLEKVYDEQIAPLMSQIIEICKMHKLPVFASFLYANDPDGDANFSTTNLMPEEWNRPIPEEMLKLLDQVYTKRCSPLQMRVKNADGETVEETIILG